ncbi:ADP-ribosyl cyclase/cyclic ADP-ribose hydrolase 1-like [Spea bombifrons]|uniref:ADP-ribosyl cyclase/cyclic ADP-ribose hydrolase 1-like n=1 Tax=Spea bombifrons TaxID=233779 RepID=UPI00234B906D|nr:ADP-ribosyl cyclase/cyclic ADP-ribose hydrolase 1-like [Spea bombifrons]
MPQSSNFWSRKKIILLVVAVLTIVLVASCVAGIYFTSQKSEELKTWKGKGTTKHFKEIFLGRCHDYLMQNPDIGEKDCNEIWQEVTKVVYKQDQCAITEQSYERLAELAGETVPCNKSLLWSRTNRLVHRYTKAIEGFRTLEDTFLGYLFNGLTWCGKTYSSEMNFQSCPAWDECYNNSMSSFWRVASAAFARSSCGVVHVMLNASADGDIARKESIFRTIEVPNMHPERVSVVRLWLISDINGPERASCNSESVLELKHHIEKHKLEYNCVENYRPVKLLQCIENPDAPVCKVCH